MEIFKTIFYIETKFLFLYKFLWESNKHFVIQWRILNVNKIKPKPIPEILKELRIKKRKIWIKAEDIKKIDTKLPTKEKNETKLYNFKWHTSKDVIINNDLLY